MADVVVAVAAVLFAGTSVEPVEDGVVSLDAVVGFQQPVVLAGPIHV
jgi:hypothetical protein